MRVLQARELRMFDNVDVHAMIFTQQIQQIPSAVAKGPQVKPLFGLAQEDVSDAKLLLRGISATVNRVFRFFASTLAKNFRRAFEANWANWAN